MSPEANCPRSGLARRTASIPFYRREGEADTGRPATRRKAVEPDLVVGESERAGERIHRGWHTGLGRQRRQGERGMPAIGADRLDLARHRPDIGFKHEIASTSSTVETPEQQRGAHGRVPGECRFLLRRKDTIARAVCEIARRQHEHGFRQIEFTRDGLHGLAVETFSLPHDGERIALEAPVGKDIEGDKSAFHGDPISHHLGRDR